MFICHFRFARFTSGSAGLPGAMEPGAERKVQARPGPALSASPGSATPRSLCVPQQRQREEAADGSDMSGEDDEDYVPYVPVKQRKQQMVTE